MIFQLQPLFQFNSNLMKTIICFTYKKPGSFFFTLACAIVLLLFQSCGQMNSIQPKTGSADNAKKELSDVPAEKASISEEKNVAEDSDSSPVVQETITKDVTPVTESRYESIEEDLGNEHSIDEITLSSVKIHTTTSSGAVAPVYEAPVMVDFSYRETLERSSPADEGDLFGKIGNTKGEEMILPGAGTLTAGEIHDFSKWKLWSDLNEGELKAYQQIWRMAPVERYCTIVQNKKGMPVADARVELLDESGNLIWQGRSDNKGQCEVWNNFFTDKTPQKVDQIRVSAEGKRELIKRPKEFSKGVNSVKMDLACDVQENVDIAFVVDATGSMGDEISYLQAEMVDVITKVKSKNEDTKLRLASVFYRDHEEEYVVKSSPFSENIQLTSKFVNQQYAEGGGDGPEAAEEALMEALDKLIWSSSARARLLFFVLDAAPHEMEENLMLMEKYTLKAAAMGVRIIPLVASGSDYYSDKSLEYLMRCEALATNGTYAFLTDHSGVGMSHTAPSTDKYKVELLNDLLVRIIRQFSEMSTCESEEQQLVQADSTSLVIDEPIYSPEDSLHQSPIGKEESLILKYYPNPATDYLMITAEMDIDQLYVTDLSGKILQKITPNIGTIRIDLNNYPSGMYQLRCYVNGRWLSGKFVVMHM
jgi:hypothetical protein